MGKDRLTLGYVSQSEDDRSVIGYIRVSTEEQKNSGLSIQAQEQRIKEYAGFHKIGLSKIHRDEAESGKDLERPAVREIMELVQKGKVGHIIIYKLDRLTRSLLDLSNLLIVFEKRRVTLSSVTENLDTSNATGRLMVQLIGMFAEWERGQIVERTKLALDQKRARGEKLGGIVPYGYRVRQGRLIPHEPEHKVLRAILEARNAGKGYQEIATALNEQGVKPRSAKSWYAATIRLMYLREGLRTAATGGQVSPGTPRKYTNGRT